MLNFKYTRIHLALLLCVLFLPGYANAQMTGKKVYRQYCAACHDVGTANAPRISDAKTWEKLLATAGSSSALTNTVIKGKGAMPAKGTCANCSEQELRDSVEYMLAEASAKQKNDASAKTSLPLNLIKLPKGFHISIYAENIPGARQMTVAPNGVVFVGTRGQGKVYALLPNKGETQAAKSMVIASGLNEPNGVAFYKNNLYVSEIHQVIRYDGILKSLSNPPKPTVINTSFPNRKWHGYKYIKFGPDGYLYIGVGMPCNTCDYRKTQPMFGTIMRMLPDGKDLSIYAKGIRNTVGFAWNPATKVLWFTDNGQDLMGDGLPPDEINRAPKAGMDFGFPFVYGNNVPSPGYGNHPNKGFTPAAAELPAHVAPLGMTFYNGTEFPKAYRGQMFVAEHGSWNRSSKIGYQMVVVQVKNGIVEHVKPFAYGWLQGQTAWGRPVDVITMPDGALLISDDQAGVIYRVSYKKS